MTRPYGASSSASSGSSAARAALERRIEVGEDHVVGLDRLEAPGLQALAAALEDQRGRGVAHRPVGGGGLALELGGRARGGARQGAIGLVGGEDVGVVDARDDRTGVEPVDAAQAGARSPSSSSTSGVVNCMSCSARKAASPSAGSCMRAATTARQARDVAATWCLGCVWNGIP